MSRRETSRQHNNYLSRRVAMRRSFDLGRVTGWLRAASVYDGDGAAARPRVYICQRESLIDCRRVSGDNRAVVVANESIHRQGVIIPFTREM